MKQQHVIQLANLVESRVEEQRRSGHLNMANPRAVADATNEATRAICEREKNPEQAIDLVRKELRQGRTTQQQLPLLEGISREAQAVMCS